MQVTSIATSACEPDLYTSSFQPKDGRLTVTNAGVFGAEYCQVDLADFGMQAGLETLPRIFEGTICGGRHALMLQLQPGPSMFA